MKVFLEIPSEFEPHYNADKFQDSFKRILFSSMGTKGLTGLYEYELIKMLSEAFVKSQKISDEADEGDSDNEID